MFYHNETDQIMKHLSVSNKSLHELPSKKPLEGHILFWASKIFKRNSSDDGHFKRGT